MPKLDDESEITWGTGYGEVSFSAIAPEATTSTIVLSEKEPEISYRYSEQKIIQEIKDYIDATYDQHYSRNKFQATEFILDCGHGDGFCIGNIMKYAQRYGKKDGYNRKDLLKIIHYAIIALHNHDMNERK
jgi:hypothetical protein